MAEVTVLSNAVLEKFVLVLVDMPEPDFLDFIGIVVDMRKDRERLRAADEALIKQLKLEC